MIWLRWALIAALCLAAFPIFVLVGMFKGLVEGLVEGVRWWVEDAWTPTVNTYHQLMEGGDRD